MYADGLLSEELPASSDDPSFDMTEDELRRYCSFLYQQLLDKDRMNELILSELQSIKRSQGETRTENRVDICELRSEFMSAHREIALLLKENRDLQESLGQIRMGVPWQVFY